MGNLKDSIVNLPASPAALIDATQIDDMKDNDLRIILKRILNVLVDHDTRLEALEKKVVK